MVERIADIKAGGAPPGGDDWGKALKADAESRRWGECGGEEMAVLNEVENGEKEKGFVWGKAFRARA